VTARFRLRELLEQLNVSQSELKRRSGVSFTTINGIANNKTQQVHLDTVEKLAAALGIEPGDLLERAPAKRGRGK
jgi:DNA-binding Xre family transcriptional regulator